MSTDQQYCHLIRRTRCSLCRVTLFLAFFIASASFLILSGLAAFAVLAWRFRRSPPPPPRDPRDDAPSPDDPDPDLDVWAEFDRQRELAPV